MLDYRNKYDAHIQTVHCDTHNISYVMGFVYELHGQLPSLPCGLIAEDEWSCDLADDIRLQAFAKAIELDPLEEFADSQPVAVIDLNALALSNRRPGAYRYEVLVDGEFQHARQFHINYSHHKSHQPAKDFSNTLPISLMHRCAVTLPKGALGSHNIELVIYRGISDSKGKPASWLEAQRWVTQMNIALADNTAINPSA